MKNTKPIKKSYGKPSGRHTYRKNLFTKVAKSNYFNTPKVALDRKLENLLKMLGAVNTDASKAGGIAVDEPTALGAGIALLVAQSDNPIFEHYTQEDFQNTIAELNKTVAAADAEIIKQGIQTA